ncbi:MAG: type I-E CRISPR-associated protein Cse2/CasB [Chloroflexi bacterium]|nr:MAG: type I-E CRISPR-associated protein Cse2/CasB [Chloroflexota bacterium]
MSENKYVKEFIKNLSQLDDGERARLKRNAGRSLAESHQVSLLFFQKIAPYGIQPWAEDRYFLISTLYPFDKMQREKDRKRGGTEKETNGEETAVSHSSTLGSSFRFARSQQNETGFDRRFSRLLDANEDQLPFQLRQAIIRLANDWITINWEQLTKDVLGWTHPNRYVQRKWARDYVASKPEKQTNP